jgi:hypothetical protein
MVITNTIKSNIYNCFITTFYFTNMNTGNENDFFSRMTLQILQIILILFLLILSFMIYFGLFF